MKLTHKQQTNLNEFTRKYLNPMKKTYWNKITMISGGKRHQEIVTKICLDLAYEFKVPFATEPTFKTGYKPDIMCPIGRPYKIIEVRYTETEKETKAKESKIPEELKNQILYVEAKQEYNIKLIS